MGRLCVVGFLFVLSAPLIASSEFSEDVNSFGLPAHIHHNGKNTQLLSVLSQGESHSSNASSDDEDTFKEYSYTSSSSADEAYFHDEHTGNPTTSISLTSQGKGPRCTVLSLDGGGVRGYVEALILSYMEKNFRQKLSCQGIEGASLIEAFDLVVGTSAGAITAGCLTVPNEDDRHKPRHDLDVLLKFYEGDQYDEDGVPLFVDTEAASMFTQTWWRYFTSCFGLFDELYSTDPLKKALKKYGMKDTLLRHACIPTAIVTAELANQGRGSQPVYFRSYDRNSPFRNINMRDATLCSGAAPTYFERMCVTDLNGQDHYFVDGALTGANNPAVVAAGEAAHALGHLCKGDKDNMFLVSVGTGIAPVNVNGAAAADWGLATWVRPIIDLTLSLPTLTNERTLQTIFGKYKTGRNYGYVRLTPQLAHASPLDDARPEVMLMLRTTTLDYIGENQKVMEKAVDQLVLRYLAKQQDDVPGKRAVKDSFTRFTAHMPASYAFTG